MRNNKLARELSFMPPAMGQKLAQAKNQRFKIYLEQRTNPHHLIPDTVKKVEYCFVPADMSDPNIEKLQQDETVTSIQELLAEVDEAMFMTGLKFVPSVQTDDNLEQYEAGEITLEKYNLPPAPKARNINSVNAEEGANMRSHGNGMHKGHWVHHYRDPTLIYDELPAEPKQRMVYNLIGTNEEERANKRSHDNEMSSGHRTHPSKIPRKEPSDASYQNSIADSSDDMNQSSSVSSYVSYILRLLHKVQKYIGSLPFTPPKMERQIPTRQFSEDCWNMTSHVMIEYLLKIHHRHDRGETKVAKEKAKPIPMAGKPRKEKVAKRQNGSKPYYGTIHPFGSSDGKISLFNIKDFYENHNPYPVSVKVRVRVRVRIRVRVRVRVRVSGYPEKVLCTQYPSTRCSTLFSPPARLGNPYEGVIVVQW
jgi:hypothetical protein